MKLIIQDRKGKQMIFQTLFEVEELGNNCKTFICDEWLLTDVENWSGWMGEQEPVVENNTTLPKCIQCGDIKGVKISPYDFNIYCKEHQPSINPDKVIKTNPKMSKNL
jgi:hypothetical protein